MYLVKMIFHITCDAGVLDEFDEQIHVFEARDEEEAISMALLSAGEEAGSVPFKEGGMIHSEFLGITLVVALKVASHSLVVSATSQAQDAEGVRNFVKQRHSSICSKYLTLR